MKLRYICSVPVPVLPVLVLVALPFTRLSVLVSSFTIVNTLYTTVVTLQLQKQQRLDTTTPSPSSFSQLSSLSQKYDVADSSPCNHPTPTVTRCASNLLPINSDASIGSRSISITDDDTVSITSRHQQQRQRSCSYIRAIRSHNLAGFIGHSQSNRGGDIDQTGDEDTTTSRSHNDRDIVVSFCDSIDTTGSSNSSNNNCNNLIVITGETASGKSLFIVRALEILSGKITSSNKLSSYVQQQSTGTSSRHDCTHDLSSTLDGYNHNDATFVEVEVILVDPHLSALERLLQFRDSGSPEYKSEQAKLLSRQQDLNENQPRHQTFTFRRTLRLISVNTNGENRTRNATTKYRLKSECTVNGKVIPLKQFVMLTSPLFAIVDATTAIGAIMSKSITNGNGSSNLRRTALLDSAICKQRLWKLSEAQQQYRKCRALRVKYEKGIHHQQALFRLSTQNTNDHSDNSNIELISHYISELDHCANRMTTFCQSLARMDEDDNQSPSLPITRIGNQLSQTAWNDNANEPSYTPVGRKNPKTTSNPVRSKATHFASKLYELLLEFRSEFKVMEDRYQTAKQIVNTLGSLSISNSAVSALERTRKLLTTITDDNNAKDDNSLQKSTERLHELLNQVDQNLRECLNFVEYDQQMGLLPILDHVRSQYSHVSIELIDDLVNEWKSLSRKHSVSPYVLPQCHDNYINERDGTNQLQQTLLPRARADEEIAYQQYSDAYREVTNDRETVAHELSRTITTKYLPLLGFPTSTQFTIDICRSTTVDSSTDHDNTVSAETAPSPLVDRTDFFLSRPPSTATNDISNTSSHSNKGNLVHDVSSSGERARILFAIECALPGSIGTACRTSSSAGGDPFGAYDNIDDDSGSSTSKSSFTVEAEMWYNFTSLLPIVTIYDEIDAHIGGRAVKAMMQLLVEQSCTSPQQLMAITHNPTIAAAAHTHVIIQKIDPSDTFVADSAMLNTNTILSNDTMNSKHVRVQEQQAHHPRQSILVSVVRNDPYNERRLQELVRMVCGSEDDDNAEQLGQSTVPPTNVEAMTFVRALVRDSFHQ